MAVILEERGRGKFKPAPDYKVDEVKELLNKKIEEESTKHSKCTWRFIRGSIADKELVSDIFEQYQPDVVVNLAAQAGVRYSITNPDAYIESNLVGFYNILESCRHSYDNNKKGVEHLVYACLLYTSPSPRDTR